MSNYFIESVGQWRKRMEAEKGWVTSDHCISGYNFNSTRVYKPGLYTSYRSRLNFRSIEDMMGCRRMMGEQKERKKMVRGTKEREGKRKKGESNKEKEE